MASGSEKRKAGSDSDPQPAKKSTANAKPAYGSPAITERTHNEYIPDSDLARALQAAGGYAAVQDTATFAAGWDTVLSQLGLPLSYQNRISVCHRVRNIEKIAKARASPAAIAAREWGAAHATQRPPPPCPLPPLNLLDMDEDSHHAIMHQLPCKLVRGPLLAVSHQMRAIASSSAALGGHVDVAFLGGTKSQSITPILNALAKLNRDGGITSVALGNHNWGSTTTKKLLTLFPALEKVSFCNTKKVARHHDLMDWSKVRVPALRDFSWGWAFDVDSEKLLNVVRNRSLLEKVDLKNCELMSTNQRGGGIGDDVLEELGRSCPSLKTLRLQGDLRITDRGIQALLAGCKSLCNLMLDRTSIFSSASSHVNLTSVGLQALAHAGFEPGRCIR